MKLSGLTGSLLGSLYNALYPPRCPVCDDVLFQAKSECLPKICPECRKKISFITQPACMKCGKQLEEDERELCFDCTRKQHEFKRGVAAFSYTDAMKGSMYAFKYRNRREYAGFYAQVLAEQYEDVIRTWGAEALIPVPLHKKRLRKRGYNQAQVLAEQLSKRLGIPVDSSVLKRIKNTRPQKACADSERFSNIENAFQTTSDVVKYKNIILIDDIFTTGTTMNACARELKRHGVVQIFYITVCIGRGF